MFDPPIVLDQMLHPKTIYERVNSLTTHLYNVKVFHDLTENDNRKNDKTLTGLRTGATRKRIQMNTRVVSLVT